MDTMLQLNPLRVSEPGEIIGKDQTAILLLFSVDSGYEALSFLIHHGHAILNCDMVYDVH